MQLARDRYDNAELLTSTSASPTADSADVFLTGRPTASTSATLRRLHSGNAFAAWLQSIDGANLTYTPHTVHITRSVYDLRDQVTEVFDARQLGFATWTFGYNPSDPDFTTYKNNNLFGQVEEARDADGLRYFEYDHRGLVTKTSHRFWGQTDGSGKAWDDSASTLWSTGSAWDPAIPSAARGTLSDWLVLDDLSDTTTVVIESSYDAAARPTQVDYPEGMSTRISYNQAATLDKIEVDRGTGAGFFDVVKDLRYDARGKLTELTHGNGVVSQRTYDGDLERLTRRHAQVEQVLTGSDPDSVDVFYVHTDYLGSGHVLTSAAGALLSQEEYFGRLE